MSCPGGRAARARRCLRGTLATLLLAVGLAAGAGSAGAQESSLVAALGAAGPETMVVQITLNQQKKGQYFVNVVDGGFLVRSEDLKAIGLVGAKGRTVMSGNDEYVWVNSIPGLQAKFRRGAAVARPRRRSEAPARKLRRPLVGPRPEGLLSGQRQCILQLRPRLRGRQRRIRERRLRDDADRRADR